MKSIVLITTFLAFTGQCFAHEHREQGAHVHGSAKLNLAFDAGVGKVEIDGPGDSFIGFEHKAVSVSDQRRQALALESLEKKIPEMVMFESSLSCVWTKEKIEVKYEQGGHSDLEAAWSVKCQKPIVGSKITFNFQKFFPKLHDLDLQILADSIQISAEAKKSGTEVWVK